MKSCKIHQGHFHIRARAATKIHAVLCGTGILPVIFIPRGEAEASGVTRNRNRFGILPWSCFINTYLILLAFALCVAPAWGQSSQREPHIGYLYPAGGRQGSVVQVKAGGQFLIKAGSVNVTGQGVRAVVVGYVKPYRPLTHPQYLEAQSRLEELRAQRRAEIKKNDSTAVIKEPPVQQFQNRRKQLRGKKPAGLAAQAVRKASRNKTPTPQSTDKSTTNTKDKATKKDNPLLADLETMNLRELDYVAKEILGPRHNPTRKQQNSQIAETVLMEITIDPDATPGERELRLVTLAGLTNPLNFQVGQAPEILEQEPNDPGTARNMGNFKPGSRQKGAKGAGKK